MSTFCRPDSPDSPGVIHGTRSSRPSSSLTKHTESNLIPEAVKTLE